jgi:predicted small lipoprotein YifL
MKNAVAVPESAVASPQARRARQVTAATPSRPQRPRTLALIVVSTAAAVLLAACGNKGPLRLPGDPPKKDARTGPRPTAPTSAPPPPTTPGMTQ